MVDESKPKQNKNSRQFYKKNEKKNEIKENGMKTILFHHVCFSVC